jgi:hypothetical protein
MKSYEQHSKEGPEAYHAFTIYRDMGVERSTAKVGQKLGKSKALMDRWSSKNQWVERVAAYDVDQDRVRQAAEQRGIANQQEITAQRILNEEANIGFARITDVVEWKDVPGIVDSDKLSDEAAATIESVEFGVTEKGTKFLKKINFHAKQPALTKLGETKKLWGTKEDPTTQNNFYAIMIEGIRSGELQAAMRRKGILDDTDKEQIGETKVIEAHPAEGVEKG